METARFVAVAAHFAADPDDLMSVLLNRSTKTACLLLLSSTLLAACSSDSTPAPVQTDNMPNNIDPTDVSDAVGEGVDEIGQTVNAGQSETENPTENTPEETEPVAAAASALIEHAALMYIAEETGPTGLSISARAGFYSIVTPLVDEPVLKPMNMLDSCELGAESSQINATALNLPIDHILEASGSEIFQIAAISAGDTVEIDSDSGTYASLVKDDQSSGIDYVMQAGSDLTMSVPDMLNLNISGDAFPMLQTTWTTPARLDAGLRDAVRTISADAVLTWDAIEAADGVQSRVHIYAGFLNELSGEFTSYQCELADDGEFSLPADVQALYGNALTANFVDVARYTRRVEMVNGISVVNVFVQRF